MTRNNFQLAVIKLPIDVTIARTAYTILRIDLELRRLDQLFIVRTVQRAVIHAVV